jgi:hypothetical protein
MDGVARASAGYPCASREIDDSPVSRARPSFCSVIHSSRSEQTVGNRVWLPYIAISMDHQLPKYGVPACTLLMKRS